MKYHNEAMTSSVLHKSCPEHAVSQSVDYQEPLQERDPPACLRYAATAWYYFVDLI